MANRLATAAHNNSQLVTAFWMIPNGNLPKQILINEHWVLSWYCNKTKNHPATAIQSTDMCDSKILSYLFILVHM